MTSGRTVFSSNCDSQGGALLGPWLAEGLYLDSLHVTRAISRVSVTIKEAISGLSETGEEGLSQGFLQGSERLYLGSPDIMEATPRLCLHDRGYMMEACNMWGPMMNRGTFLGSAHILEAVSGIHLMRGSI